jgi:[ribosomal protein S5]-alanine N-acetyltransferase
MRKPYLKMPNIVFGDYMLRTIKISDYMDLYDYGKNKDVVQFLSWGPMTDPKEAKDAIKYIFYPRTKKRLPRGYAIVDLLKQKMIGTIDYHSKIENKNGAEIGFVLHPDYWNQGIMTEALKILIDIGFEHLNYDVIKIRHIVKNIASQMVISKTPFQFIGKEPFEIRRKNKNTIETTEVFCYELTKEDYHVYSQSQGNL